MASLLGAALVLAAACAPAPAAAPVSIEAARAELRELITDVTKATAYRYKLTDDQGRSMGPTDITWIPEAERFAAVYFTWDDGDQAFHVHLATSDNLMDWTWEVELAYQASQPTIAAASGGGYVVAWEQEPDPIHMVIVSFATWDDLRAGAVERRFDVPVTMPACGEGTPSIDAASSERVNLSFHYHGDCERDRQAAGWTDWTTWQAVARPERDQALIDRGVAGHIGDRDTISFRGHDLMLIEGELVPGDWSSWRTFLYDAETGSAEELRFRTHAGSAAFSNPTIDPIEIGGREAILVTLYLFTEGAQGEEDEELLFYRTLPDGT
jgi:hypothetical protein